jgi:hypothetical protein
MTTRETANGNLQNKIKVGSLFRSSSKAKLIKVSRDNKFPRANSQHGGGIYVLSGMKNERTNYAFISTIEYSVLFKDFIIFINFFALIFFLQNYFIYSSCFIIIFKDIICISFSFITIIWLFPISVQKFIRKHIIIVTFG